MADIDSAKMAKVANDLREMEFFVQEALLDANKRLSKTLLAGIKARAPQNENDTKPDQPNLVDSFERYRTGTYNYSITSNAPHAIELNTTQPTPHPISSSDGALAWVPENPAKWKRNSPGQKWFYDEDNGKVVMSSVQHPGVSGNNYIGRALTETAMELKNPQGPVNRGVRGSIQKAGFKRVR